MTRLFGTNGIRGVANKDLTCDLATTVGKAIGTFFDGGAVALGMDVRTSSEMLKAAVLSGLLSTGCEIVDVGIMPTPCLQYYVKSKTLVGGVMITASHNPPEYNGIKVMDSKGMELDRGSEEIIEGHVDKGDFRKAGWNEVRPVYQDASAAEVYINGILTKVNANAIRKRQPKVVLDCGNGAACLTSPTLLTRMGCRVITINGQPDGHFPGRPPEPVVANLSELMKIVPEVGADLGIAHDGDADRSIFVDEHGDFVHGDATLALMAREALKRRGGLVVTPVSSSSCVEEVVKSKGGMVQYTKVGAPIVARTMYQSGAIFGGEENGGLIFPEHQFCRDGGMAAAKLIEVLVTRQQPLSQLLSDIPKYHLFKTSVPFPPEKRDALLKAIIVQAQNYRSNTIDGVKIFFEEGWVLIRPSGTESIFRIFAESRDSSRAEYLAKRGEEMIENALQVVR